ncbi:DUF2723 domain-containing protein [candidate division WOR-3 bacterium]|nr:DUF2723 domain-containing protein [candidate division WOR-3 bacterium]
MFFKKFIRKEVIGFFSVFVVLFSVYLYTIAPTVSLWDCGEFIACSHILGVPHPPGTPFYVLMGRVFDILFPFKEVAKRINFLSILAGSVAGGFLYLVVLKVLSRFKENKMSELPLGNHLIAVFSSIGAGFCFSVWNNTVEAEVYSISLLIVAIGIWLVLQWDDNRGKLGNNNFLLLLVYLLALSFGIHLLPFLLVPGALLFIILVDWKVFKNPKLIGTALILIVIGVSTYLYLIIRAQANPAINESNPATWAKLWEVIMRKQYGSEGILGIFVRHTSWETNYDFFRGLWEQIKIFFRYFSWQFFPYPRETTNALLRYLSVFGTSMYVLFGLWGMVVHFKKDRKTFYLIFILFILVTIGLVVYLNHEFSPSDPNPAHQPREPRERDYFWIVGFFFFMFYVAMALYWMHERFKKNKVISSYCVLPLSFIMGFIPLISNIESHANRRENWIAHDYAHNLLSSADENSVFFTNGDNDTFPLWFLQEVKGFRKFDSVKKKGVRVACFALMNTEWYIKQMKESGIPMDFDTPFRGTYFESVYLRGKRSKGIEQEFEDWIIDNLPYLKTNDGKVIERKEIATRLIILCSQGINPTYNDLIMRSDSFVGKYIKDDFNPSVNIYFSSTVSPSNKDWIQDHLLLEGLAYRLVGKRGKNMMDVSRFLDLFENELKFNSVSNFDVYKGPAAERIVRNYISTFYQFGLKLMDEAISSKKPLNLSKYKKSLNEEKKEKLKSSAVLFKKAIDVTEDYSLLIPIFNELRIVYLVLGKSDIFIALINEIPEDKFLSEFQFFKGQLFLDELMFNKDFTEEKKQIIAQKAEIEFKKILGFSEDREKINAYIGLLDLYEAIGEKDKKDILTAELINYPKIFSSVFMYNYDYKKDTAISIYLLKKWLEVNSYDKKAKLLLDSLATHF